MDMSGTFILTLSATISTQDLNVIVNDIGTSLGLGILVVEWPLKQIKPALQIFATLFGTGATATRLALRMTPLADQRTNPSSFGYNPPHLCR